MASLLRGLDVFFTDFFDQFPVISDIMSGVDFNQGRWHQKPACRNCIRCTKWIPVVFIVAVVSWSYYAYIVHLCILTVALENGQTLTAAVLAILYHLTLIPFLASYWKTVWTDPGGVPKGFKLYADDIESIESSSNPTETLERMIVAKDLVVETRSLQGEIRYCSECSHIKVSAFKLTRNLIINLIQCNHFQPDRCHHCSVCEKCVLKMDHHCPW